MTDKITGHIAAVEVRDGILDHQVEECPTCKGPLDMGYGLAGGGMGAYGFCGSCGRVVWKCLDEEE